MKELLPLCLASLLMGSLSAQDIHFSQYFFAPQWLNPAEIGAAPAQYRATANQRTQWREVSQPYTTFAAAVDGQFEKLPDGLALGAAIMNDRAGDSRFNTFSLLIGSSYSYQFDEAGQHGLTGGLQTGLSQVSIDYSSLRFDRQYDGVAFDPNLPTGENFARNNRWHFNLSVGALYTYSHEEDKQIHVGWASHNLHAPDRSFYNDVGVNLPLRHSFYATATWRVHPVLDVLPAVHYMRQATFSEMMIGGSLRYELIRERSMYRAIYAGYHGRIGDSGIGLVGLEVDDWRFGLSYDINLSTLEVASRNRGGFEFSLQYLFRRLHRAGAFQHQYCPVFL